MGRPRKNFQEKDKFHALEDEFKSAIMQSDETEIRVRISQVALNQAELDAAQKDDQDLAEKAEAYKTAAEVYREGRKVNKLKIQFCKQVLDSKGT